MYDNGTSIERDIVESMMWFNLAVAQGNKQAINYRELVRSRMTPEEIDEADRRTEEWKRAHQR